MRSKAQELHDEKVTQLYETALDLVLSYYLAVKYVTTLEHFYNEVDDKVNTLYQKIQELESI